MPLFETIDAKAHHCGQIVRVLRREHRDALIMLGVDAHRELRACFDASYLRRAWFADGRLIGLGGIMGAAMSSSGFIWLALSEQATRYPVAAVKEARRQIAEALATKATLIAGTVTGDFTSARFIHALGFTLHARKRAGDSWVLRRSMQEAA